MKISFCESAIILAFIEKCVRISFIIKWKFSATGEGNGNPFQYSCLENSMDRRAWQADNSWGHKESDMTEWLTYI